MPELLLLAFYFIRPVMFIEVEAGFAGLNLFEVLTVAAVGLLVAAKLTAGGGAKRRFDRLDWLMLAFGGWCMFVTLVQSDVSDPKIAAKWILPYVVFMLLRRVVRSEAAYSRYLRAMVIGCFVIVAINTVAIALGVGLTEINWVSGLERYKGVFTGVHTMGHTMAFAMMVLVIYFATVGVGSLQMAWTRDRLVFLLGSLMLPMALYCIYRGNVRTVLVGLFVFTVVWLFQTRRRTCYAFVAMAAIAITSVSYFERVFRDVRTGVEDVEQLEMAGSGRPAIWRHNLEIYVDLPFDKKILGTGVGNVIGQLSSSTLLTTKDRESVWDSHNDYLEALMETGLVGFVIVVLIYWTLYQRVRRMSPVVRPTMLAFFLAVVAMNLLSNSYLSRFGLGQLFMMTIVAVDVFRLSARGAGIRAATMEQFRLAGTRLP